MFGTLCGALRSRPGAERDPPARGEERGYFCLRPPPRFCRPQSVRLLARLRTKATGRQPHTSRICCVAAPTASGNLNGIPSDVANYPGRQRSAFVRELFGRKMISSLEPHPVICARPVDRWEWLVIHSEIHSQLCPMVHDMIQEHLPVRQKLLPAENRLALKGQFPGFDPT